MNACCIPIYLTIHTRSKLCMLFSNTGYRFTTSGYLLIPPYWFLKSICSRGLQFLSIIFRPIKKCIVNKNDFFQTVITVVLSIQGIWFQRKKIKAWIKLTPQFWPDHWLNMVKRLMFDIGRQQKECILMIEYCGIDLDFLY